MNEKEKLKFSDFVFYHFDDDEIYNLELERKGLRSRLLSKQNYDFNLKFDPIEILKPYIKELIKKNPEENFILGLNNFKINLFNGFKTGEEIFSLIKEEWKYYAKRCDWEYVAIVKLDGSIYIINEAIECHIHYPSVDEKENVGLLKLLVMANNIKHFVHFNELSNEEKNKIPPKVEVFRKIENYFYNNFYNSICINLNNF